MAANRDAYLYLKSDDPSVHQQMGEILLVMQGGKDRNEKRDMRDNVDQLTALAAGLNPERGAELFNRMLSAIEGAGVDETALHPQGGGRGQRAGYWVIVLNFGWSGEEITELLIEFFGSLMADGDARAYMEANMTDWFCRYENGKAKSDYYSPFEDRTQDDKALASGVYAWWHEGLPELIREGQLNGPNVEAIYREIAGEEVEAEDSVIKDASRLPSPYRNLVEALSTGDTAAVVLSVTEKSLLGIPLTDFMADDLPREGYFFGEDASTNAGICLGVFPNPGNHPEFRCTADNLHQPNIAAWPSRDDIGAHIKSLGIASLEEGGEGDLKWWRWPVADYALTICCRDIEVDEGGEEITIEMY